MVINGFIVFQANGQTGQTDVASILARRVAVEMSGKKTELMSFKNGSLKRLKMVCNFQIPIMKMSQMVLNTIQTIGEMNRRPDTSRNP